MSFNCKRIIVCGMSIEEATYKAYFDSLYSHLINHLPSDWVKDTLNENLMQVEQK